MSGIMDLDLSSVPTPELDDCDNFDDMQFMEFLHSIARDEDPTKGQATGFEGQTGLAGAPPVIPLPANTLHSGMC
jgi:hypothetical protein